ncbi:family 43 glycosylhydrolase [Pelagicoccus mobilis]|uniref:Family 43 glycosylhydrolase n=1 Tax=Pelagicoccus mobilis TaxID=415221 RepID=A0A934S4P2_9BACT|nr:family 43 glycosylhydrolase [Pelagicoccus mobilis]MBK1879309.1 family 43 glycosylhydrolase [Pelagicoccus mobilis]
MKIPLALFILHTFYLILLPTVAGGTYQNPILAGHYHDPTVLRVGEDYYLSHCEHDRRGPIIWHSRDLVNWRPLARVDSLAGLGEIWATDLVYHEGKYYLYLPLRLKDVDGKVSFSNYVTTADHPAGPWSEPIDLKIGGIDPGHVVGPDGQRYVFVNKGRYAPLTADGTAVTADLETAYHSWEIPSDWTIECECLESPKFFWRDDWCYLVSALGGTAGPSTSHMVVVARARDPRGPWENDPASPLLRTEHRDEPFWSQGHGTIIEATGGSWWMLYHGIAKERRSGGRNTLMLPIDWTDDGWPQIKDDYSPGDAIPAPPGENVGHGMPLSDDFQSESLAIQWDLMETMPDFKTRIRSGNGKLKIQAKGDSAQNATRVCQLPTHESYELTVQVEAPSGTIAGIGMQSSHGFVGLQLDDGEVIHPRRGMPEAPDTFPDGKVWLKVRNNNHDVDFFYSSDGTTWKKHPWGAGLSTESVQRIILFAAGQGQATFRNYQYKGW